MFTHKNTFLILILFSILFVGCATTYAPDTWLPETEDVQIEVYGGWMTIVVAEEGEWIQYGGEFIGQDEEFAYVLYDTLFTLSKANVQNFTLELDQKNISLYALWSATGFLVSPFANGVYSIFTAPLWMIGGISTASGESFRDRFEIELPTYADWESINQFARFPQGIKSINLNNIKPKLSFEVYDSEY